MINAKKIQNYKRQKATSKKRVEKYKEKKKQEKAKRVVDEKAVINGATGTKGFIVEAKPRLSKAEAVRQNIMIEAEVNALAVQGMPLGVISLGYSKGWFENNTDPMYWAYQALLADIIYNLRNENVKVVGRARYINTILESYRPKTVGFKTGVLSYAWKGTEKIAINNRFDCRTFGYFLFERSTTITAGGWATQTAPPNASTDGDIYPVAASLFALLADSNRVSTEYELVEKKALYYTSDVSPYASNSPYYGQGNGVASGAFSSCECEVPTKSKILANLSRYQQADGRIARKLALTSGDSTAAYALGYLPSFSPRNYDTCYPIVYKYLDIDEVVLSLQYWYISLVSQAIAMANSPTSPVSINTELTYACQQFSWSPQTFRLMIRQAVLGMFSDSQALGQFLTFHDVTNPWEPLRVGSNCYGIASAEKLVVPNALNENLRCLLPVKYKVISKFQNSKNRLFFVPIWGIYTGAPIINSQGNFLDEEGASTFGSLFLGDSDEDPRMVDGVDKNGNVCDLNRTTKLNELLDDWNYRLNILQQFTGGTSTIGGASNGSVLSITRVNEYPEVRRELETIPRHLMRIVEPQYVHTVKSGSGKTSQEKQYYVPPNASLIQQRTFGFTSVTTITETLKQALPYLILPIVTNTKGDLPTLREYRTGTLECNILQVSYAPNTLTNRATDLRFIGGRNAPGLAAGNSDEMNSVVNENNAKGSGGFLGDILGGLARELPF